ncbi:MAG: hypothetical protein QOG23_1509 [Blastocatellia bacterium]|jgi:hypothetical protein|nr:hypothetical protein [Blastocatellia bacterium]
MAERFITGIRITKQIIVPETDGLRRIEPRAVARDATIQVEFMIPSLPLRVLYLSSAKAGFLVFVVLHIPNTEESVSEARP